MNRLCHRIVFNKQRGQLMAVAETAHSQGKGGGQSPARRCRLPHRRLTCISKLVLASGVSLSAASHTLAQIRADANAPRLQQPTVLNTANGTPLVNIQTPSAAGVSRNSYGQFDVQAKGAVLNNARTDAPTQLGGWVQGNPWLARGSARVILNEVNSSSATKLKGFVEVAGPRADVIIANPSGIQIDGGGFINAGSAVLTTGTPRFGVDGSIKSFRVQGGTIRIDGAGLDTSQTDYTALLARALEINAGIWAKDLRITTGTRDMGVDASPGSETLPPIDQAPRYALDSSLLGGMYAQRIRLIGTEAGLGVRHDGKLVANQISLSAEGRLDNGGTIYAQGDGAGLNMRSPESINNTGTIAGQGNVLLVGQSLQSGSGSIIAAGLQEDGKLVGSSELQLLAEEGQQHRGQLLASGLLRMEAPRLDLKEAVAHGTEVQLIGDQLQADRARLSAHTLLHVRIQHDMSTQAASLVADKLDLQAATVDNRGGEWLHLGADAAKIQVGGLLNLESAKVAGNGSELTLQAGQIQGREATVQQYGSGALRIGAANMILAEASLQSAGALELQAADLMDLRAAQLGSGMTTAVTTARLDHRGAQLLADAGVQLHVADQLLNDGGQIQSATGGVTLRGQAAVSNSGGLIAAIGGVDLEAHSWSQAHAGTVAGGNVRLQLTADLTQSADSSIRADRELRLQARQLNSQGQLQAGTDMTLNTASHADLGGRTYADHSLLVSGGGDLRLRGLLATQGDLHIKAPGQVKADANAILAAGLDREEQVRSGSQMVVDAGGVLASQGRLMAERVVLSSPQGLDLSHSQLQAWGELAVITAGALITEGSRLSVNHLDLRAQDWHNAGGQVSLGTTSKQDLTVDGRLDNQGGLIHSDAGELRISAQTLDNQGGAISGRNLDLTVHTLRNTGEGLIASEGKLTLKGDTLINSGVVQSKDQLYINSRALLDNTGRIRGLDDMRLAAGQLTQQGSTSALGNLLVRADRLQGSGTFAAGLQADGTLASTAALGFDIAQRLQYSGSLMAGAQLRMVGADLQLQGAQIQAAHVNLQAQAQELRLDGATVAVAGDLSLQSPGLLSTQGAELSGAKFTLRAVDWLNTGGRIGQVAPDGGITATVTGRLDNSGSGQIVANGSRVQLEAAQLDNRQGSIVQAGNAGGVLKIQAGSLHGEQGTLLTGGQLELLVADAAELRRSQTQAQQLELRTGSLQHQGAQTLINGAASIVATGDLNNRGGLLQAAEALTVQTGTLRNEDGQLDSRQLFIRGGHVNNLAQGLLQGRDELDLTVASIHNAGHLQSGRETKVQVSGELQNSGVIYAEGSTRIDARHLEHSGTLAAGGDLLVKAVSMASSGAFSAGWSADNSFATQGALEVTATGRLQHSGISLARGRLSMSAADLALQGSRSEANEVLMQAGGDLRLQGAQLATAGALQLQAGTLLDTSDARLTAAQVTVSATDWQHAKGQLLQSAASGGLNVQISGSLLNQEGRIEAAGRTTTLQAASINNEQGHIVHAGQGPLHLKAGALIGHSGQLLANGDLDVEVAGHADLRQGQTQARDVALRAASLQHEGGQLLASGKASVVVQDALENQAGLLQASGTLQLQAGSMANRDGQVSGKQLDMQLGELDNAGQALIRAQEDLRLDARIARNAGGLQAGGNLDIKADTDLINNGSIYAQGAARLSLGGQLQNDGTLAARDNLMLQARAIAGSGTLAAGLRTDNTLGSEGSMSLRVAQGLKQSGALLAAASLNADAAYMQLEGSRIHAGQSLTLSTPGTLTLDRASVASPGAMVLSGASDLSTEGASLQATTVTLQAGEWRNTGGTLTQRGAAGELKATIAGTLKNAGGQIQAEGSRLRLEAAYLNNADGRLVQAGTGDMSLQVGTLQGQAGQILAKNGLNIAATDTVDLSQAQTQAHTLTIDAASLDHRGGSLQSTGATTVNVVGQLNNHGGVLLSAARMQLRTGSIDNAGGLLQSNAELLATVDAELKNQQGQLRSVGDMELTAKSLDNRDGGRIGSSGGLRVTAGEAVLNNGGSLLADQPLTLAAASLANQQGQIASLHGSASLRVTGQLSNEQGRLQAADTLDVVSGSLNNHLGELSARHLLLDSQGQTVDNFGGRLLAKDQLSLRSGSLDNTGGLIRSEGGMSLQLEGEP